MFINGYVTRKYNSENGAGMTKEEAIKEIIEYIRDSDKCISEDDEYIRGWKSALLVALETINKIDD